MNDRVELTARSLLLGAAVTLVFTAANVYLGLKVGLTFASTIPAAVISMAVLRAFKNSSIYENNIVQTVASAAGTLSAVIFVLPGLIMIGWWSGFPFAQCFGVCAIGGILGVMYSVPLRRALVTQSSLPYPEGVAAAEVLKVGTAAGAAGERNRAGLLALVGGTLASAGFAVIVATRIFAGRNCRLLSRRHRNHGAGVLAFARARRRGATDRSLRRSRNADRTLHRLGHRDARSDRAASGSRSRSRRGDDGLVASSALHRRGCDRRGGPVVSRAPRAPRGRGSRFCAGGLSASTPRRDSRGTENRAGLADSNSRAHQPWVLDPTGSPARELSCGGRLTPIAGWLTLAAVIYVVIAGFFVAAACGYMAGLIGSSNSPVSGLAILVVIGASLMLLAIARFTGVTAPSELIAYALFVTAVLLCVATISNDNLQDLKTGQLVDATPWRQQVALVFGVAVGALVIPPILNLLNRGYGFAGAPNLHDAIAQPLPAPQATLISALAKGVIGGQIDWSLIATGALVGAIVVAADELLRTTKRAALPPLAVGLGIYLPASTTAPVVVGAVIGWLYNRWAARAGDVRAKQIGVLIASGLIVGESLFGVLLAGLIVSTGRPEPLGLVGDAFAKASTAIGAVAFVVVLAALFRWAGTLSRSCASSK